MSKYDLLWKWINENKTDNFKLTYDEIENIAGVPIDHSFLTFKKELLQYGFNVAKISMKGQVVDFEKVKEVGKKLEEAMEIWCGVGRKRRLCSKE